ncbi:MAG: indolepyruvate ferredoxin oxidoreductase subunit alpha [Syntrophobacterales bacterium]|nr:indolepyruvate ferredoxin oxidoreductase subunit alpha [Syntrophobacterales bacterium]
MAERKVLLGNEAIAYGLIEAGCSVAASYPGTPASEILDTILKLKTREHLEHIHAAWSINEKVAFEIALAASYAGVRSAVMMKQVGLNVASDPMMSSAYTGTKGGFVIISADDPGPHSSQTEQDSRFFAMFAKIPVFDPSSPKEAKEIIPRAFELSEQLEIPVMLRPTTRICHARQDVTVKPFKIPEVKPSFEKNPPRWAATPKFRLHLHRLLNNKIRALAKENQTFRFLNRDEVLDNGKVSKRCIVSSGITASYAREILESIGLWHRIPFFQVIMPYPLSKKLLEELASFDEVMVFEETYPVIELQIRNGVKVLGRETGHVPQEGELLPEKIEKIITDWLQPEVYPKNIPTPQEVPQRRPTLCPGCGHRSVFFAIRKCFPKGVYPSDIGCYTLGINLGSVDTVLCMGASISQAIGFSKVLKEEDLPTPVIATIGDSTFFHAGIPPLIEAVAQKACFILIILDNKTTAMTGHQPTPENIAPFKISIKELVKACGVSFIETVNAYDLSRIIEVLKEAGYYAFDKREGVAVVIVESPCVTDRRQKERTPRLRIRVTDKCRGCQLCSQRFECPALVSQGRKRPVILDEALCAGCGVCIHVCPFGGLEIIGNGEEKGL